LGVIRIAFQRVSERTDSKTFALLLCHPLVEASLLLRLTDDRGAGQTF
jgi:hypothetical protein